MKIDTDELERVARGHMELGCGPLVVVALVGRIRELEESLRDTAHRAGRIDLIDGIDQGAVSALLAKGVTL